MSGYLPGWAEDDPSSTGVPMGRLALELSDMTHEAFFGGQLMRVCPGGWDPGADTAVLGAVMQCRPFDVVPAVPLVSVQLLDDFWVTDLDPTGVVDVAERFRSFADLLVHTVAPALTSARRDWAEHVSAMAAVPG